MPSLIEPNKDPAKIILIAESGAGKTGSLMSLICAGYNLRMIDTDKGKNILRGLLDPSNYPYMKYIQSKNIDLAKTTSIIPISTPMITRVVKSGNSSAKLLAPKHARAWQQMIDQLENWKDGENNFGNFNTWGPNDVLVLDSFTTIARQAYYYSQEWNGHLGMMEEGYTHQRDVGAAQTYLRRLLEMLFDADIKCNIVLICHIGKIDESRGIDETPEARLMKDPEAIVEVKGYPQAVGVKLSKNVAIYFNDSFIVQQSGSGMNVRRKIVTTPTNVNGVNIAAKNSAFLNREYDITTGLAEIFATLTGKPKPQELIDALSKNQVSTKPSALAELKVK